MGRSFRFMAFRCAAALPLCSIACVLSNGMALAQSEKITAFQAGCSADSAPCSKGMVIGFQGNFEVVKNQPSSQLAGKHTTAESLGTKTIEGIQVAGTRTTSTLPAGTIGNEEDLTTTREEWYSPELKLVVQSTQNDPRFGQTTYTLNDIQQGPPDAALFQVPADYKVEEMPVPKPVS
jgi:hypothetical protein